ncbi:hypothetical protein [Streptomonospora salina]|uniref:hypothetical protein n=1 Tax=Streptomonospora salina TaxID=104205 RepID=UPI0031E872EF
MARYWFGESPADFVVVGGEQVTVTGEQVGYRAILYPGARLWVYDYATGTRISDLLDSSGASVTEITASSYGRIPRFRGPDDVRRLLIGQAEDEFEGELPDLHKWTMLTLDWPPILDSLTTRVADLEAGGGDVIATAHPLIWALSGTVDTDHVSAHPYWAIEGREQTITAVRAQATVTTGQVTCRVLTIDATTGDTTPVAAVVLDTTTDTATVTPDAAVSDGTGVTVEVERGTTSDEVADITVQVMLR